MSETLAYLLDPLDINEFRSNFYTRKAFRVGERPDHYKGLFGYKELNQTLNSSPIPHPTMKMVLHGSLVSVTNYQSILDYCRKGATLIIDQVDYCYESIGKMSSSLAADIGQPIQVTMYFSQTDHQGFARHYDTHDVLILQIEGFKKWRVFEPTLPFPLFNQKTHGSNPPDSPYFECTLEKGDILYIPRGHWHEGVAAIEPSLHLTVGILDKTGIEMLSWLVDELREDVEWRKAFPLAFRRELTDTAQPTQEALEHLENLKKRLIEKLNDPFLLAQYYKHCAVRERNPLPFNFPTQVTPITANENNYSSFSRTSYQQAILTKNDKTGMIEVSVWNKVLKFSQVAEPILKLIFSNTSFSKSDLLNSGLNLSWKNISVILNHLIHEGIIEAD